MGRACSLDELGVFMGMDAHRAARVMAIAVGEPLEWSQAVNALPDGGVAFVSFEEVTERLIALNLPAVVFSPVLARRFDCIDLALRLAQIGFRGAYRAVARDLPMPGLIEREVLQACPDLDFAIVTGD